MNILITGGTGSIGSALAELYKNSGYVDKIVIYSRDEQKHYKMGKKFPEYPENLFRYIVGDVRNYDRLKTALSGIDVCIHTAAMKHVDICEYNPLESYDINVNGTANVIKCCGENNVKSMIFLSTDKACLPVTVYGAQKMVSENIVIAANNIYRNTRFNVLRYGNVLGSNGSVFSMWEQQAKDGKQLTVTDVDMTRFFWSIDSAASFIQYCETEISQKNYRGVVIIPIMSSYKIIDCAKEISRNIVFTGLRCVEKIHEDLINSSESIFGHFCGSHYLLDKLCLNKKIVGQKLHQNFYLNSKLKEVQKEGTNV